MVKSILETFNEDFLRGAPSVLSELLPEFASLSDVVRVIDIPRAAGGAVLELLMSADQRRALAYLSDPEKESGIVERIENIKINGAGSMRVPNTCSVTVKRIEGEAMTMHLSMLGFALSSGSACATGDSEPSHVLLAMGIDPVDAQGALRISLGIENTDEEVDAFLEAFPPVVRRLREMSPVRD